MLSENRAPLIALSLKRLILVLSSVSPPATAWPWIPSIPVRVPMASAASVAAAISSMIMFSSVTRPPVLFKVMPSLPVIFSMVPPLPAVDPVPVTLKMPLPVLLRTMPGLVPPSTLMLWNVIPLALMVVLVMSIPVVVFVMVLLER